MYRTCGWIRSGKRREALKPTICCISLLVCRRPPSREQITVAGSVASWSRLPFPIHSNKHLTHYLTVWRGLIEIDSFVENESKKDQCLPILHCTALRGIVPVAVGLYSSRNKHTASLPYRRYRYLPYICKLPPTNNGKFTAFVHSHLVIRKVHILCFVIVFFGEVASLRRRGWGRGERTWSTSVDRQAHSGCSICFLLLKVEIS